MVETLHGLDASTGHLQTRIVKIVKLPWVEEAARHAVGRQLWRDDLDHRCLIGHVVVPLGLLHQLGRGCVLVDGRVHTRHRRGNDGWVRETRSIR